MDDTPRDLLKERLSTALGTPPESDWSEVEHIARTIATPPGRRPAPTRNRGRPRRPLWSPRVVVALLATLLLVSGAAAAITLTAASSPPVQLGNGSGLCPGSYPYVADTSQKRVYPPNYPGLQVRKTRVTRCFASLRDARTDGYTLAPPPATVTMFGPLYMGPVTAHVRQVCQAAQRHTHAVIYCPSRLPTPLLVPASPDCPSAGCSAPELSITGGYAAPTSYIGSAPGEGGISLWSASPYQLRHDPILLLGCGGLRPLGRAQPVGHTSFRGHPATWYECTRTGPAILAWHIGTQSYGISADGPTGFRQRLVRYIAAHLVALRPR